MMNQLWLNSVSKLIFITFDSVTYMVYNFVPESHQLVLVIQVYK